MMHPRMLIALLAALAPTLAHADVPTPAQVAQALAASERNVVQPLLRRVRCGGVSAAGSDAHCSFQRRSAAGAWSDWYAMLELKAGRWVITDVQPGEGPAR